jgi:CDP-diacylglycerol--serine O-phosphatidyltransferase
LKPTKTKQSNKGRFRGSARLRMGLSIIPSLFTIGNMFCGYYSIASSLQANYDAAAIAIGVGALLDMLDGRIARMTNTSSDFGLELDSLADLLTFGVAPSVLALNWGIGGLQGITAEIAQDVYKFGWLATFAFLIAGALRLARFNVLAHKAAQGSESKSDFVGLPIPAGAGVVAAIVHFQKTPLEQIGSSLLWCLLIAVVAFLMISTVRYPSFKELNLKKPLTRIALAGTAMLIGLIVLYSEIVLLLIATLYMGSGPVSRLSGAVRGRLPHHSVPPPESHAHSRGDTL